LSTEGPGATTQLTDVGDTHDELCNVNLAVNFENKPNGLFYTHLSQNKEANNFIDNQGHALHNVDIALDFLDPNISIKVKERITTTRDVIMLFVNALASKIQV
jgi:hypothetical protein